MATLTALRTTQPLCATATAHGKARTAPLRTFPGEDIYFFTKRIDNSRVVRQADPKAGGVCWKMIGSVGVAALLLIGDRKSTRLNSSH